MIGGGSPSPGRPGDGGSCCGTTGSISGGTLGFGTSRSGVLSGSLPGFGVCALTALLFQTVHEAHQIVGVLLFGREYLFHEAPRRRIFVADVLGHLAVALDRDALRDQVFAD